MRVQQVRARDGKIPGGMRLPTNPCVGFRVAREQLVADRRDVPEIQITLPAVPEIPQRVQLKLMIRVAGNAVASTAVEYARLRFAVHALLVEAGAQSPARSCVPFGGKLRACGPAAQPAARFDGKRGGWRERLEA